MMDRKSQTTDLRRSLAELGDTFMNDTLSSTFHAFLERSPTPYDDGYGDGINQPQMDVTTLTCSEALTTLARTNDVVTHTSTRQSFHVYRIDRPGNGLAIFYVEATE